jgi:hypothetical protein
MGSPYRFAIRLYTAIRVMHWLMFCQSVKWSQHLGPLEEDLLDVYVGRWTGSA